MSRSAVVLCYRGQPAHRQQARDRVSRRGSRLGHFESGAAQLGEVHPPGVGPGSTGQRGAGTRCRPRVTDERANHPLFSYDQESRPRDHSRARQTQGGESTWLLVEWRGRSHHTKGTRKGVTEPGRERTTGSLFLTGAVVVRRPLHPPAGCRCCSDTQARGAAAPVDTV